MRPLFGPFVAATFVLSLASGAYAAQHEEHEQHHPDQASEATGASEMTPQGGGEGAGGGMMSGGGAGMMQGGMGGMMGKHGRGMGKMHGRHGGHHGRGPSVVINIYPGGGMGMMGHGGGMMSGGMGMMGQGGGMMSGGGMDMMGQGGGMMSGGGMMRGQGAASDQPITADQARVRMTAMMARMGGGMALGEVKELDEDLIDAELTDPGGASAGRMIMNRHSGAMMRVR